MFLGLFEGRRQGPILPSAFLTSYLQPRKRPSEIQWSPSEDNVLKNLAERYPNNWRLIADAMNSSRLRTRSDMRTPMECFERWKARWFPGARPAPAAGGSGAFGSLEEVGAGFGTSPFSAFALDAVSPPIPSPLNNSQMTTRGVKRQATSAAQNSSNLTVNTATGNTVENRKRRRHYLIHETMRKASKRRDAILRANRMSF